MSKSRAPDVFRAIADPNRRRLLDLLSVRERAAQELANEFDISFAAVSQHLRVLRRCRLVTSRATGRQRLYQVHPERLLEVYRWVARYREFWPAQLRKLGAYLDRRPRAPSSS